jgi:hypothetical protein
MSRCRAAHAGKEAMRERGKVLSGDFFFQEKVTASSPA